MRVLRVVAGFVLPCGCVGGVYELYNQEIVLLIDVKAVHCPACFHRAGAVIDDNELKSPDRERDLVGEWDEDRSPSTSVEFQ